MHRLTTNSCSLPIYPRKLSTNSTTRALQHIQLDAFLIFLPPSNIILPPSSDIIPPSRTFFLLPAKNKENQLIGSMPYLRDTLQGFGLSSSNNCFPCTHIPCKLPVYCRTAAALSSLKPGVSPPLIYNFRSTTSHVLNLAIRMDTYEPDRPH